MKTKLSPALNILHQAESARKEGCRTVFDLLAIDPTSTLEDMLVGGEQTFGETDRKLLESVANIVEDHNIKQNITDWPFEYFWGNPYEPRHSKLLRYFIDPNATHGCGSLLLRFFLDALKESLPADRTFPVDDCRVSQPEYIDILIERDCKDGKYAIIIENKVNWASDQSKQLQRYVESVKKRGFDTKQIFVFYLPLTSSKDPDAEDLTAITKTLGVHYSKITFERHISNWLETVLEKQPEPEWPTAMQGGMLENIRHYRNLIRYLVNKEKAFKMNHAILKRLEKADRDKSLPMWSQVSSLQKSATELKQCLESVLRGKLLLRVRHFVRQKEKDIEIGFYLTDGTVEKQLLDSPYDEGFEAERNLGIHVNDAVLVCFGGYPEESSGEMFWLGYMRNGTSKNQEAQKDLIMAEAQRRLKDITKTNQPWYVWDWNRDIDYDKCVEESVAERIADRLLDMRDGLVHASAPASPGSGARSNQRRGR